jgi:hypothetical protein
MKITECYIQPLRQRVIVPDIIYPGLYSLDQLDDNLNYVRTIARSKDLETLEAFKIRIGGKGWAYVRTDVNEWADVWPQVMAQLVELAK